MSSFKSRIAFTLVELLVVMAIIALLIGLVTFGVQKVRESSYLHVCKNNLRQIGMGLAAHHDEKDAWPSGGCSWQENALTVIPGTSIPSDYQTQQLGWLFQLLPYVGQKNLWMTPNFNTLGGTLIEIYRCPLYENVTVQTYGSNLRTLNTYEGNAGEWLDPNNWSLGGSALNGPLLPTPQCPAGGTTESGRAGAMRAIGRKENVTDGLSNTMIVGEKYFDPDYTADTGANACNADQGWLDGWDNDAVGTACGYNPCAPNYQPPLQIYRGLNTCSTVFGSQHRVGMHALFCDGSVHLIDYNIDPVVWAHLLIVNDGMPIPMNQWID
jgi:prepilin-type N-terminal cleavage/methylation domain-containing protein